MEGWSRVLGCPCCRSALQSASKQELGCANCGHSFPVQHGIPSLLRPEDVGRLANFSQQYRQARVREGWRPMTQKHALALPFCRPPGYPALYWEVRRQSYRALMHLLTRQGPSPQRGPVADMGAGTGWLSCRLAQAGYRVLALEASLDKVFGLGATDMYLATRTHFLPVQGNLEHPPLQEGTLSLAIFNASLHYAADLIGTLRRSAESLQPDGRLIVLDTPVARHPVPGTGRGNRHLGRQELHGALLSVGLRPRWVPVRRAVRWWVYQMKMRLKGDAPFSFPMVVADRNPK